MFHSETTDFVKIFDPKLFKKVVFNTFSSWSILISNVLIALFAIIEKQNILNILWIYWFQSVIIGVYNFLGILSLQDYSVDGMKMNNRVLTKSKATKVSVAAFFLFHYGFFHFVYAIFLSVFTSTEEIATAVVDIRFILLTSLIFFFNYLGEFLFSFKKERSAIQSLPKLMFTPYKRIIPMHLTIIA